MYSEDRIELIFYRNLLMDRLEVQLENGSVVVVIHWVVWLKITQKPKYYQQYTVKKTLVDSVDMLQQYTYGLSSGPVSNCSPAAPFLWVIWLKLLKNILHCTKHSEENV